MMQWPDLRAVLTPVPWAVVGAVATRLYMPERGTADLDVLVTAEDFARAEEKLTRADWRRVGDLSVGGSTWESPQGVALGLPYSSAPWCRAALAEAQNNRDHQGLPILPLPYLVLVKLAAGRTLDIGDVSRMLGLADDAALQRVREAVAMHAPDDLEDLEALIQLGKLEWGDTA